MAILSGGSGPDLGPHPVHSIGVAVPSREEETLAWIDIVNELGASGRLRELYEGMIDPEYGRVDTILRIHSLHPEGLRTHYELYREMMKGTPTLRKVEREMIALVVSVLNECQY
jgi:alkylhydroperoxidase family enzyme